MFTRRRRLPAGGGGADEGLSPACAASSRVPSALPTRRGTVVLLHSHVPRAVLSRPGRTANDGDGETCERANERTLRVARTPPIAIIRTFSCGIRARDTSPVSLRTVHCGGLSHRVYRSATRNWCPRYTPLRCIVTINRPGAVKTPSTLFGLAMRRECADVTYVSHGARYSLFFFSFLHTCR